MSVCETNVMPSSPQWVFGPFRLDPEHACLWGAAQAIPLPPKVFAVLHYLVTHTDRLVTKDELLDAVRPAMPVALQLPTGEPPGAPATPLPDTLAPPSPQGAALPLGVLPPPEAERRPLT